MSRACGILFGALTHGVFFVTVWYLYWFLQGRPTQVAPHALEIDALLALQFTVWHSLLLLPSVRKTLGRWIGPAFYGLFYCLVTCTSLGLTIAFWRTSPTLVWNLTGAAGLAMTAGFIGSWFFMFYSLSLTGLGYQTGFTPWRRWLARQEVPRRGFAPRGVYHVLRHPVYLSFLGLLWFNPALSLDHALLTGIWTTYIFFGSYLKDRRLAYYVGEPYRQYQAEVPGYPGMFAGPLGRVPVAVAEVPQRQAA